jgi:membrane associated rhomboid family serine protease
MVLPLGDENLPGRGIAWLTLGIIAVNIAVFVLLQLPNERFTYGYSTIPAEITTGKDIVGDKTVTIDGQQETIPEAPGPNPIYLTILTSMFMHGGWLHLGGNMLFLFIFGDNIEHVFGAIAYLVLYFAAGIVGSLVQVWASPDSLIPNLGASGAIAGVLGAYLILFPANRVRVLAYYIVVTVPAVVMIGLWALLQFVNGFASIAQTAQTSGVAYLAHVGGFSVGVVFGLAGRVIGLAQRGPTRYAY